MSIARPRATHAALTDHFADRAGKLGVRVHRVGGLDEIAALAAGLVAADGDAGRGAIIAPGLDAAHPDLRRQLAARGVPLEALDATTPADTLGVAEMSWPTRRPTGWCGCSRHLVILDAAGPGPRRGGRAAGRARRDPRRSARRSRRAAVDPRRLTEVRHDAQLARRLRAAPRPRGPHRRQRRRHRAGRCGPDQVDVLQQRTLFDRPRRASAGPPSCLAVVRGAGGGRHPRARRSGPRGRRGGMAPDGVRQQGHRRPRPDTGAGRGRPERDARSRPQLRRRDRRSAHRDAADRPRRRHDDRGRHYRREHPGTGALRFARRLGRGCDRPPARPPGQGIALAGRLREPRPAAGDPDPRPAGRAGSAGPVGL